jgi:hypothetical protein
MTTYPIKYNGVWYRTDTTIRPASPGEIAFFTKLMILELDYHELDKPKERSNDEAH